MSRPSYYNMIVHDHMTSTVDGAAAFEAARADYDIHEQPDLGDEPDYDPDEDYEDECGCSDPCCPCGGSKWGIP